MWSGLVVLSLVGFAVAGPPVSRSRNDIESFKAFLEKCRTDDGIRLESRMLANPKASEWENSGKFQGDIVLDDWQAELLLQQYAQPESRNAYIWPNTKWPSNTVIYEFSNEFTNAQVNAIYAAMREISSKTCIRFRRRANEANFVRITGRSDGCYAHVGYWGSRGLHIFNLARDTPGRGCFTHATIIHEWLHIIGFEHMHQTHNRDEWVRINWQNVQRGMEYAFERYGTNIVHNMGLPYEYASVMHYGRWGFSSNGQATMVPLYNDNNLMGQRSYVTTWDWLRANRHYNCPGAWNDIVPNSDFQSEPNYEEIENLDMDKIAAEIGPQEQVAEDMPQEEIVDEVSFVEEAAQELNQ